MKRLLPLLAVLLVSAAFAQPAAPVLLHGCNDLSGITVSQGVKAPDTKLEISKEAKYLSEGAGCVRLSYVSPENATGSSYLSLNITTKPTDKRRKALVFEAATSLP